MIKKEVKNRSGRYRIEFTKRDNITDGIVYILTEEEYQNIKENKINKNKENTIEITQQIQELQNKLSFFEDKYMKINDENKQLLIKNKDLEKEYEITIERLTHIIETILIKIDHSTFIERIFKYKNIKEDINDTRKQIQSYKTDNNKEIYELTKKQ